MCYNTGLVVMNSFSFFLSGTHRLFATQHPEDFFSKILGQVTTGCKPANDSRIFRGKAKALTTACQTYQDLPKAEHPHRPAFVCGFSLFTLATPFLKYTSKPHLKAFVLVFSHLEHVCQRVSRRFLTFSKSA